MVAFDNDRLKVNWNQGKVLPSTSILQVKILSK